MPTGERAPQGKRQERGERHAPRQLARRQRLRDEHLRGDLDDRDDEQAKWFPPVDPAMPQPSERHPDRQRPGDFGLTRRRHEIGEEVERRAPRDLDEREERLVERVERTGRDDRGEDREPREEREGRPQSAASNPSLARRKYAKAATKSTTPNAAA